MKKNECRELVKSAIENRDNPPYITFYKSYGEMATLRTGFHKTGGEVIYVGYEFHILPSGKVIDARGWRGTNSPQQVGWDKEENFDIKRIFRKE